MSKKLTETFVIKYLHLKLYVQLLNFFHNVSQSIPNSGQKVDFYQKETHAWPCSIFILVSYHVKSNHLKAKLRI